MKVCWSTLLFIPLALFVGLMLGLCTPASDANHLRSVALDLDAQVSVLNEQLNESRALYLKDTGDLQEKILILESRLYQQNE